MQLTEDQHQAARARGVEFQPATAEQIGRLTMQRRIFILPDGQPCVGSRNGAVWETHGAVLQAIGDEAAAPPSAGETVQEAAAAEIETAAAMAAEQGSGRGAQVLKKRAPGRPRAPWSTTGAKRRQG